MDLRVCNTSFEDRLVMDIYESAIWVDRYDSCGDFELQIPISDWKPDYIIPDHYLANKKSEHHMIVENISIDSDVEEGAKVIVTGESLESILKRRIVWSQTTLSGNLQLGVKKLIDENAINPMHPTVNPNLINLSQEFWESGEYALAIEVKPSTSYMFRTNSDYHFRIKTYDANGTPVRDLGDVGVAEDVTTSASERYFGVAIFDPTTSTIYEQISSVKPYIGLLNPPAPVPFPERKIDDLVFEMSDDPAITSLTLEAQYTGDNLYDVITKICRANNIGFKITAVDASKNTISANPNLWESGEYAFADGAKQDYPSRIRLKGLLPVQPDARYYFNTGSSIYTFAIRAYNAAGQFVRSWGTTPNSIETTVADEHYLSITIYNSITTEAATYTELMNALQSGEIKPFVGLAIGDYAQIAENKKLFVFKLYAGSDRSYDQTTNPYVIFSPDFDNLLNSKYLYSKAPLKNVTLVGGEGEGSDRRFTTVGATSGLNRRELFTDAKDLSSNVDGVILSESDYIAQLQQRGKEKLAENAEIKYFDGSIETDTQFQLGRDFFNGDIVQVADDYGNMTKVRIVEIIMAEDDSGESIYPTCRSAEETEEE